MRRKIKFGFIVPQGWKLDLPKDLSPDKGVGQNKST